MEDLEIYMDQLTSREGALMEYDRDIEGATEEDELDDEVTVTMEYIDEILKRKSLVKRILGRDRENDDKNSTRSLTPGDWKQAHTVKLPKLIIDHFSGDIRLWQSFWSQFESAIHQNQTLSATDKFNY